MIADNIHNQKTKIVKIIQDHNRNHKNDNGNDNKNHIHNQKGK